MRQVLNHRAMSTQRVLWPAYTRLAYLLHPTSRHHSVQDHQRVIRLTLRIYPAQAAAARSPIVPGRNSSGLGSWSKRRDKDFPGVLYEVMRRKDSESQARCGGVLHQRLTQLPIAPYLSHREDDPKTGSRECLRLLDRHIGCFRGSAAKIDRAGNVLLTRRIVR